MQVGNISLASQRFALTRCNCSSENKKPRKRKSKEERRAMVETFITKFRETNKGTFPSLNHTHKEVGGSFYTIREIVRDIIQENRVLGPGDLDMQTLTLENLPISPEICINDNNLMKNEGVENKYINDMEIIIQNDEDNYEAKLGLEIKKGINEEFEYEMKEEISEALDNGKITTGDLPSKMDINAEIKSTKEEKSEISHNNGKIVSEICINNNNNLRNEGHVENKYINDMEINYEAKLGLEIKKGRNEFEFEMEEKNEIYSDNGKIIIGDLNEQSKMDTKNEIIQKSEIKEEKNEIYLDNGKINNADLNEESKMDIKTEIIEKYEIEEEKNEISDNKGKISTGDLQSKMEMKKETIEKFEIKEEKNEFSKNNGKLSTGDLQSKMEMKKETIEKSDFKIKEEKSEFSKNNGKISSAETEKFEKLGLGLGFGDSKSNFETAKRAVVQVEQFPLPSKNNSFNKKEKEPELLEVKKSDSGVCTNLEIKNEIKNSVSFPEKNNHTMPKTGNEAVSTKIKKRPINEYLMLRHECYLKLDFSLENAKINRENAKKKREKPQANPFWVTFQAFITSVVKFWTE